ncbi:positive control sigma-like factor [compost metagenome]
MAAADLIPEYKDTRKALKRKREELKALRDEKRERIIKLKGLLTLPTTFNAERECLEADIAALEGEMKTIGSMVSDAEYVIEWLETGRRPGNRRGIERRASYQRDRPVDPIRIQAYITKASSGGFVQVVSVTDRERERIEFALGELTPRERACYEMVRGNSLPYSETAELLGIEKSTVQWFVESAEEKLKHHINQIDLFDILSI